MQELYIFSAGDELSAVTYSFNPRIARDKEAKTWFYLVDKTVLIDQK
jgi:hypothetical protein